MKSQEKIDRKKESLIKSQKRIAAEKEKSARLAREIATLEALQVQGLLQELDMPFSEVKELLLATKKGGVTK